MSSACRGPRSTPVFDALLDSDIELVVCRHEQNAAFMAAAVGRLTGTPGVALVTSGPGTTNLATGLVTATTEQDPMIAICGAVARADRLKRTHQSMDAFAALKPFTKYAGEVNDPDNVAGDRRQRDSRRDDGAARCRGGGAARRRVQCVNGGRALSRPLPVCPSGRRTSAAIAQAASLIRAANARCCSSASAPATRLRARRYVNCWLPPTCPWCRHSRPPGWCLANSRTTSSDASDCSATSPVTS